MADFYIDVTYMHLVNGAACRDAEPELFDYDSQVPVPEVIKNLCVRCPVRVLCRDYAIDNNYSGVWWFTVNQRNAFARSLGIGPAF